MSIAMPIVGCWDAGMLLAVSLMILLGSPCITTLHLGWPVMAIPMLLEDSPWAATAMAS